MENSTKVIKYNVYFLHWYFIKNRIKQVYDDNEKEYIFSTLSNALFEDPHCFMRIVLYIANTRTTDIQEISYKTILHFLATMDSNLLFNNIDLIIQFGKKDDVLFLLQSPNVAERTKKYIEHLSNSDDDYKQLLNGKLINKTIERKVYYKPKLRKKDKMSILLTKILQDPIFNGLQITHQLT